MFGISLAEAEKFLLIFVRLSALLVVMPFYGDRGAPVQLRLALAFLLALLIHPLLPDLRLEPSYRSLFGFSVLFLQSLLAGMIVGFVPLFLFVGIQLGGEIAGFQMGFGIVSVMDPQNQNRISLIAQLKYLLAFLLFIALDGHLYLLKGIVESFRVIPLTGAHFPADVGRSLVRLGSEMFFIGIKIAAPIMATILLTNVGLGIMARTLPQMNIFLVGFPLQIGLGLIALAMSVPVFAYVFEKTYHAILLNWWEMLRAF